VLALCAHASQRVAVRSRPVLAGRKRVRCTYGGEERRNRPPAGGAALFPCTGAVRRRPTAGLGQGQRQRRPRGRPRPRPQTAQRLAAPAPQGTDANRRQGRSWEKLSFKKFLPNSSLTLIRTRALRRSGKGSPFATGGGWPPSYGRRSEAARERLTNPSSDQPPHALFDKSGLFAWQTPSRRVPRPREGSAQLTLPRARKPAGGDLVRLCRLSLRGRRERALVGSRELGDHPAGLD